MAQWEPDARIGVLINNEYFQSAIKNIPDADVDYVRKFTKDDSSSREFIAQMLAANIWKDKICDFCGNKSNVSGLKRCLNCSLAFYCGKKCQTSHWKIHKLRCCKKDGPLNKGYQGIAFEKVSGIEIDVDVEMSMKI